MRIITSILVGIGVIGLIIFMLILAGCLLYSLTPAMKDHMREVPVSYEEVEKFDQKLETFEEEVTAAAEAGEAKKMSLLITEEEVNSKIIELMAEDKLPVKELFINFNDDLCWVYTVLNNPGIGAKVGIIAEVESIDGEIKIRVVDFHIGRLPLPKSADEWVANLLEVLAVMQSPIEDLPAKLTLITIKDGSFSFEVLTKSID